MAWILTKSFISDTVTELQNCSNNKTTQWNVLVFFFVPADVNECQQPLCKNGATCVNTQGSFHCKCKSGYSGKYCDKGRLLRKYIKHERPSFTTFPNTENRVGNTTRSEVFLRTSRCLVKHGLECC